MPSSRRLECEAQRNLEVLWLTGRLAPDLKTIADFRRDNGLAIKATCHQFVLLCCKLALFSDSVVAIDGSKFKAVNARDKTYSQSVIQPRMEQVEASVARFLAALDTADRHDPGVPRAKVQRLREKNRKNPHSYDAALHGERHQIKNLFAKFGNRCRIAIQCDRCAGIVLSIVTITITIAFWIKKCVLTSAKRARHQQKSSGLLSDLYQ